jgi:molecular chaperone GrpE
MEENKKMFNDEEVKVDDTTIVEPNNDTDAQESKQVEEEEQHEQTPEERIAELEAKVEQLQKDALYRAAEFDNFRKRTIQEKADLIKYGSQKAIEALLPVIDDLERAMQHIDKAEDVDSVKEGVTLIMQKFQGYLKQQQVTVIPANPGDDFDDKIHEAITMFPAPDPSLKGKIVDCPTKGYKLYDKVVRYAKVVVGQ